MGVDVADVGDGAVRAVPVMTAAGAAAVADLAVAREVVDQQPAAR